jgi:subtilisin family serine protease
MRVAINCHSKKDKKKLFKILSDPNMGTGPLLGKKKLLDDHPDLDHILEFDLTQAEIDELRNTSFVKSMQTIFSKRKKRNTNFTTITQQGIPRLASFTKTYNTGTDATQQVPVSLLHSQNSKLQYGFDPISDFQLSNINSIDCSNVDILIFDSGVDATHPDFFDENGNTRVVDFDWTQLKNKNGKRILKKKRDAGNYLTDTEGHGTSCASVCAGNRCGIAKNAKIYLLKQDPPEAIPGEAKPLKLALAFQKAKNKNLYGLDSTRPTIWTNSWGYNWNIEEDPTLRDDNTLLFGNITDAADWGINGGANGILAQEASIDDNYFRECSNAGMHIVVAAGNNNQWLSNNVKTGINCHVFNNNLIQDNTIVIASESNYNAYTVNNFYGLSGQCQYIGEQFIPFYNSPNCGLGYSKNDFPIIQVGDVLNLGAPGPISDIWYSAGPATSVYAILSSLDTCDGIVLDDTVRYTSFKGPFFIKSPYSAYGPDVDIYATGNATWSAWSNQAADPWSGLPTPSFKISNTERYIPHNGTSAATPIVAGILATIVAANPKLTPRQARDLLLKTAVRGNIMQTVGNTLDVNTTIGKFNYIVPMPFGSDIEQMSLPQTESTLDQNHDGYFGTGNIYDVLYNCRFFDSNNLLAQAWPLRTAVLSAEPYTVYVKVGESELTRQGVTIDAITNTTFTKL